MPHSRAREMARNTITNIGPNDPPYGPDGLITVEGQPMAYWLPPEAPHPDEWPEEGHDDPETEESLEP